MMENLSLNLIKKWFDMILSTDKKEEYREMTTYWCSKLLMLKGEHLKPKQWENRYEHKVVGSRKYLTKKSIRYLILELKSGIVTFKPIDTINFLNGMTPPVPGFKIKLHGIIIDTGKEDWGAIRFRRYFVLKLGDIIVKSNIKQDDKS